MADECVFLECYLTPFTSRYDHIHIPLSAAICIFGSFSNVINVIVLTRKEMKSSVNVLLTGLSAAQFLLALNYLILLVIEQLRALCFEFPWAYGTTVYRLLNVNFNIVFHTIAFTHTIMVAIFRYGAIRWPMAATRSLLLPRTAGYTCVLIWLLIPVMCTPVFLAANVTTAPNGTGCHLEKMYDLSYSDNAFLVAAIFWMFGIVIKLIPSFLLSCLMLALVRSLKQVQRRRYGLSQHTSNGSTPQRNPALLPASSLGSRSLQREKNTQRTTRMLIVIMVLCIVVEFPHGLLNLGIAFYGEQFAIAVYDHLGSFMEMLTLFYSSVSFTLYCIMSNNFQSTFRRLFLPFWKAQKQSRLTNNHNTSVWKDSLITLLATR